MECGSVEFYTHVSYWRGGIVGFSVGCVRSSLLPSLCSPNFSDVVCDMFAVGFFCTDISGAKLLGFSVEFVRSRVLHPRFWGPNYLGLVCDESGSSERVKLDFVSLVSRLFLLERCV